MSRWLKATFASSAFVLICLSSFLPWEAHADDITITSGTSSDNGTLVTSPRSISWRAKSTYNYFNERPNALNESQADCDFPCGVRSALKVKPDTGFFTSTAISNLLRIEGQNYGKWFRSTGFRFDLDGVVIPVGVASTYIQIKQSMLFGMFLLSEHDRPTGFEPVTMITSGHPLLTSSKIYRFSLSNAGLNQQTAPATSDSSEAGSFNFSSKTKPTVQGQLTWPVGPSLRRVFAPRIPVQFWRRINFENETIIPAAAIRIRAKGDEAPHVANGRIRR